MNEQLFNEGQKNLPPSLEQKISDKKNELAELESKLRQLPNSRSLNTRVLLLKTEIVDLENQLKQEK